MGWELQRQCVLQHFVNCRHRNDLQGRFFTLLGMSYKVLSHFPSGITTRLQAAALMRCQQLLLQATDW